MVKITNRSAFFKAVNMVASKMEGDRSARMALAHMIVSECKLTDVNTLFNREDMTTLVKLTVSAGITPEAVEASKAEAQSVKPKKVRAKRVKRDDIHISQSVPMIVHTGVPMNIRDTFGDNIADTCDEMIMRYIENANKYEGEYRSAKAFEYADGMKALSKVENFIELQGTMCAFFLRDYITKVAKKFIQFGIGYKLKKMPSFEEVGEIESGEIIEIAYDATNETRYNWDNASSNAGNITQYDANDIMQEVVTRSYSKVFSETMFDAPKNVLHSLFFRISNAVQKMMNQLKRETQVKTKNGMYVQTPKSTIDNALWLVEELGIFGEEESKVLKLALQGFQKKEIDTMLGKRTDRTFKRMEKQYSAMA